MPAPSRLPTTSRTCDGRGCLNRLGSCDLSRPYHEAPRRRRPRRVPTSAWGRLSKREVSANEGCHKTETPDPIGGMLGPSTSGAKAGERPDRMPCYGLAGSRASGFPKSAKSPGRRDTRVGWLRIPHAQSRLSHRCRTTEVRRVEKVRLRGRPSALGRVQVDTITPSSESACFSRSALPERCNRWRAGRPLARVAAAVPFAPPRHRRPHARHAVGTHHLPCRPSSRAHACRSTTQRRKESHG